MRIGEKQKTYIKNLRQNQTDAEKVLWFNIRAKRFQGLKFKRQQAIDKYIVDFVCFDRKLILEIDGGQHNDNLEIGKDRIRTRYLESRGFKVIRFWNNDVLINTDLVLEEILRQIPPLPNPLPPGGRGSNSS